MTTDYTRLTLRRLKKRFLYWLGNNISAIKLREIKQKTSHAQITLTRHLQIFQLDLL